MKSHNILRYVCARLAALGACLVLVGVCPLEQAWAGVHLSGLDERQQKNVRAHLSLTSAKCDSARGRIERLYRDSNQEIRTALRALGYYEPAITGSLNWDDECWQANYEIVPGNPVRYRNVDLRFDPLVGADDAFNARHTASAPAPGDILDHGLYEAFKSSLLRASTFAGFFDAEITASEVVVDRDAHAADVNMEFSSGIKYRFGDVSFTEGILRPRLLERYSDIQPGDPYSAKLINQLYEALNGSTYFASVLIVTDPLDTEAKTVPVNVVLTPAKRRVYSVGTGYTTDTGAHGRLGFMNRRMNRRGHQLEAKLYSSTVRSEINAAYRWPRGDPRYEWFSVVAGAQTEETETSQHDKYKIGVLRTRKRKASWLETQYVDFEHEDFTVADQTSTSKLLIFGTNWETARGRKLSRVSNGYRLGIDLRGASESLASDTSFLQLRTNAKWIRSFGSKTRVLARSSIGTTRIDEFTELPASVRFFAGGDRSVRGYEFESLGPVDADGDVIGGSHQIDASVEFDYLFKDQWSVAAFADIGSAFNDDDIEWSTGVGTGIRWYSPVGPIRLDFAHPLDDPGNDLRIHISLGPDL